MPLGVSTSIAAAILRGEVWRDKRELPGRNTTATSRRHDNVSVLLICDVCSDLCYDVINLETELIIPIKKVTYLSFPVKKIYIYVY